MDMSRHRIVGGAKRWKRTVIELGRACHEHGRMFLCGAVLLLLMSCQSFSTPPPADAPRLLVTLHGDDAGPDIARASVRTYHSGGAWTVSPSLAHRIRDLAARHQLVRIDAWPIRSLGVYCVVFAAPGAHDLELLIDAIAREPGVDSAQPMHEFRGLGGGAGRGMVRLQYGAKSTTLAAMHEIGRGQGVRVGIVDTLVDDSHPDLRGRIASQTPVARAVLGSRTHGTAIAGVLAADTGGEGLHGLAPEAQYHVFGACDGDEGGHAACNTFDLAKAIQLAIDARLHVLNLSWGGPHDPLLARLLDVALGDGAIIVAAVDAEERDNVFPASLHGVIPVDAMSLAAGERERNWVLNPEKLSTTAGGGYRYFVGNSMSAAGVSGITALLLSAGSAYAHDIVSALASGECAMTSDSTDTPRGELVVILHQSVGCGTQLAITADIDSVPP
jgi:subtilisin family serine protease